MGNLKVNIKISFLAHKKYCSKIPCHKHRRVDRVRK